MMQITETDLPLIKFFFTLENAFFHSYFIEHYWAGFLNCMVLIFEMRTAQTY